MWSNLNSWLHFVIIIEVNHTDICCYGNMYTLPVYHGIQHVHINIQHKLYTCVTKEFPFFRAKLKSNMKPRQYWTSFSQSLTQNFLNLNVANIDKL